MISLAGSWIFHYVPNQLYNWFPEITICCTCCLFASQDLSNLHPKSCKHRKLTFRNNKYSLHFYLPLFNWYNRWCNKVGITGHFSNSAHSAQCRWASACALRVFVCTVCSMMRTLGQLPSKMRHFLMLFSELCPVWG